MLTFRSAFCCKKAMVKKEATILDNYQHTDRWSNVYVQCTYTLLHIVHTVCGCAYAYCMCDHEVESHQTSLSHLSMSLYSIFVTTFLPLFDTFSFSLPSDGASDMWGGYLTPNQPVDDEECSIYSPSCCCSCKQLCRFIRTSPWMAFGEIRRSCCCWRPHGTRQRTLRNTQGTSPPKKRFLGLCPKLWVGGGQES